MELNEKLAREFSRILREWLTDEEMATVIERNATDEYKGLCASHEFCDPNQAMIDAYQEVCGFPMTIGEFEDPEKQMESEADFKLTQKAWDLAKENKFYE